MVSVLHAARFEYVFKTPEAPKTQRINRAYPKTTRPLSPLGTIQHVIIYQTIPYHTRLYYTVSYYTILYCTVPYYTVLYCAVLIILYYDSGCSLTKP